ncbi:MAG: gamma-glutamyltransferase, partial [Betaproteobacteria bacterium]
IISYVARTVHAVLAGGTALQQAVEAPNIASRNGPTEIESGPGAAALGGALSERGHRVRIGPMTSGVHGILRSCDSSGATCLLESGTDPRREGFARGH